MLVCIYVGSLRNGDEGKQIPSSRMEGGRGVLGGARDGKEQEAGSAVERAPD